MSPDRSRRPYAEAGDALNDLLGFLEKNPPAADGKCQVSAELQRRMEEFAAGQIPDEEIEGLCGQILSSPESIRAFVEILGRNS
jgi:hypothetical protein